MGTLRRCQVRLERWTVLNISMDVFSSSQTFLVALKTHTQNGISINVEILISQRYAEQTEHNSVPVPSEWTIYSFISPSSNQSTLTECQLWMEQGVSAEITKGNQAPSVQELEI